MNEWMCVHWLLTSIIQGHGFPELEILLLYAPEVGAHGIVARDQSCGSLVSLVWFT